MLGAATALGLALFGAVAVQTAFAAPAPSEDADASVRSFKVHVPETVLVDLRQRVIATRWPDTEVAHLSPRQFSRAFRDETGQSPAKAIENLRVEAARLMMEQGRFPIDVVARETGFGDRNRMRRAFLRAFGQPPQVIRRNAHLAA